jgi:hypothetical protein
MLDASLAAEAILTGKTLASTSAVNDDHTDQAGESLHRVDSTTPSVQSTSASIPKAGPRANVMTTVNSTFIPTVDEYAHVLPEGETRLTPQTFLVRPTRPDQRVGKKRTPAAAPVVQTVVGEQGQPIAQVEKADEKPAREPLPPIEVQDFEHLQLNLEEAFFLSWAIGCLHVVHPKTVSVPSTFVLKVDAELIRPLRMTGCRDSSP